MQASILSFLFFSLIYSTVGFAGNEIKVFDRQSSEDTSYDYHYELLELAIKKSSHKYPDSSLKTIDATTASRGRNIALLDQEQIDVYWAGTNQEREQRFIPIRIPLVFGLLGYRVLIIHQDNLALFKKMRQDPEKLKTLIACQGTFWPDSDILEDNGYKVQRVIRFDLIFKMLARDRCQYFPRAIFEGYAELAAAKQKFPELVMFDEVLLHYKYPMYLFINKENTKLAEQLRYGLQKAAEDGSMLEFAKSHDLTKDLFPLSKWHKKAFITLSNKYLSKETPLSNEKLWLELSQ